jgi:hypothetical protein
LRAPAIAASARHAAAGRRFQLFEAWVVLTNLKVLWRILALRLSSARVKPGKLFEPLADLYARQPQLIKRLKTERKFGAGAK